MYAEIVGWDAPDFSLADLQGSLELSRVQDWPVMLVPLQVYATPVGRSGTPSAAVRP